MSRERREKVVRGGTHIAQEHERDERKDVEENCPKRLSKVVCRTVKVGLAKNGSCEKVDDKRNRIGHPSSVCGVEGKEGLGKADSGQEEKDEEGGRFLEHAEEDELDDADVLAAIEGLEEEHPCVLVVRIRQLTQSEKGKKQGNTTHTRRVPRSSRTGKPGAAARRSAPDCAQPSLRRGKQKQ